MSLNKRQLAFLVLTIAFLNAPEAAARAKTKRITSTPPAKVVSVTRDVSGNFVLLNLQHGQKLPVPVVRYLPGPDGTIMSADFAGTVLCSPASCLRFPDKAIKRMNIGQWQASPPVIRLTFTASSSRAFKAISFRSVKGGLAIELAHTEPVRTAYEQPHAVRTAPALGAHTVATAPALGAHAASVLRPAEERRTMPPTAPDVNTNLAAHVVPAPDRMPLAAPDRMLTARPATDDPNEPALRGPIMVASAPDATYQPIEVLNEKPKRTNGSAPVLKPAGSQRSYTSEAPRSATREASQSSTPQAQAGSPRPSGEGAVVTLRGNEAPVLTLEPAAQTQFKTFRLHNPERYVVDMDGIDWGRITVPAAPPTNRYIKGLRTGSPEGSPNTARLVIDLPSDKVSVVEEAGPKENELTLGFGEQEPGAAEEPGGSGRSQSGQSQSGQPQGAELRPIPMHAPPGALVVLDAGHGGSDPGAQRGDIQEKEITLEIVEKLNSVLAGRGVRIRLTRSDDSFVSLEDRVKITNELRPDAFVSVHINSLETNTGTTGIETYFQNNVSKDLAQLIHTSLVKELGVPDRNVRKARFYVINHTPVPAILAEVGFISNKEERDKLASSEYQAHIAEALADGVMLYLSDRPADAAQPAAAANRGRDLGTISALPASAAGQSFTQNLQSSSPGNNAQKRYEKHSGRAIRAKHSDEQRKTHSPRQSLKFKKVHVASTRS